MQHLRFQVITTWRYLHNISVIGATVMWLYVNLGGRTKHKNAWLCVSCRLFLLIETILSWLQDARSGGVADRGDRILHFVASFVLRAARDGFVEWLSFDLTISFRKSHGAVCVSRQCLLQNGFRLLSSTSWHYVCQPDIAICCSPTSFWDWHVGEG